MGKLSTREAYGRALAEFGSDERMVVLDADLSKSTYTVTFKKAYPERHFNMGIAECNMDTTGLVIACTDTSWEGIEDSSVRAVLLSDEMIASTAGKTYIKIMVGEQTQYIGFISGTDSTSRTYLELISNWIRAALRERNTDAERETFIKNILLENELPGDIPLKSREFKVPYAVRRIVFLIRVTQSEGPSCVEILHNLFPDRKTHYILAMFRFM